MSRCACVLLGLTIALVASCKAATREEAPAPKARIVSAGSAITETLYALGAGDEVVAVDSTSLYPEAATKLPQIGYLRTLAAEGILALSPTLVLASGEAGPPTLFDQLRGAGVKVEVLGADPTVEDAKGRIRRIAELTGRDASKVVAQLDADLESARLQRDKSAVHPKVVVLYAHGANTVHVFGRNSYADTIVQLAGGENAITGFEGAKPLTSEALALAAPDVIVLPERALEHVGGIDGLLQVPGMASTPAGKAKRFATFDDVMLFGFGPRTGQAALELGAKLRGAVASQ